MPSLRKYLPEMVVGGIGLASMHLIFMSEAFPLKTSWWIDRASAGQVGDFIGGYFGTIFSLLSLVLLVITIRRQASAFSKERFESRYFKLLELHRDNVAEMKLRDESGRRIFVLLLDEFREILRAATWLSEVQKRNFTQRSLCKIAYYTLFYGIGEHSTRMLRKSLGDVDPDFISELEKYLTEPAFRKKVMKSLSIEYLPFDGHQSRLGHYYRHLFQSLVYVKQQSAEIDKKAFAKMLRAQLSTHEQALLLINSLTPLGSPWWEEGLIVDFQMVRNLPEGFLDPATEIDATKLFERGYFEWQQSRSAAGQNPLNLGPR